MKLLQFFEEANGDLSSARLFAFLISLTFIWDYAAHIVRGVEYDPSVTLVGMVVGVIGAKVAQKFGEEKPNEPPKPQ